MRKKVIPTTSIGYPVPVIQGYLPITGLHAMPTAVRNKVVIGSLRGQSSAARRFYIITQTLECAYLYALQ